MIKLKKYFYIYNTRQADFFHKSGLPILEIGTGKSGDTFVKFERDEEADSVFRDWMSKKDNELLK